MAQHEERIWYAALKAKDARFDGHFFVGVSSTGIYCRPICRAKLPKPENCTFYTTAAAAEQAGFRPCLLCRPERAPGTAPVDATLALVHRAKVLLEENCGSGVSVEAIAEQLGCTDRHMRRVFSAAYNVTPVQYLQTCRLLLAKSLLTDTDLSVIDVAMAAGFGSLRRFNDLFKTRYRMAPTAFRRQSPTTKSRDNAIVLALGYRPPYQWRQMLDFLAQRAIAGVETVIDGAYVRTVHLVSAEKGHVFGWVRVGHRPESNVLTVTVDGALLPVLTQVLTRIRHLFDLFCDPDAVYEVLAAMNTISPNLCTPGTRLPGCFDPFEMAVRAVLGQQITVKAARTLAARLVSAHGTPVATGIEGLTHAFPSPQQVIALDGPIDGHLGPLGITGARARTILELAQAMVWEKINFNFGAEPHTELKKLMAIPGIGPWTAQYIAMRAMGWPDAFPDTDFGVKKALAPRTAKEISALAETWRPWRSYATVNLWNSL
ncbi:DNA-3-methyladenine glycosylase 2 [Geomonas agri]|uniref:DNA-3-methyladenine glycosylase 2 n=1 Tax=Geomonas agri TaxID=2873702 RepID=UPI001CD7773C|nr:DNA-3-methyladenine glycosylase 2 [Geomonas agri]